MQPEAAIDMKQRFIGHCNVGTDIKQANFLGQRGVLFISFSVNFTISSELYHNFTKCAKNNTLSLSLSLCVCVCLLPFIFIWHSCLVEVRFGENVCYVQKIFP
jgi:hypothetical protein